MAKRTSLQILADVWNRQKSLPFEIGPLEIVSEKLFYLGIALRQRPTQQQALVGIAADRIFYGENKRRVQVACERFALEVRRLGGTCKLIENPKVIDGTGSVWHTWHAEVRFEDMGYKSVNKQQRLIAREARQIAERMKLQEAEQQRKRSKPAKIKKEQSRPVVSIPHAPRLVKKVLQAS